MTKLNLMAGVAAIALLATPTFAADLIVVTPDAPVVDSSTGWYLSVYAGGLWPSTVTADDGPRDFDFEGDLGWIVGAAVGTHFTENLRGEIEVATSHNALTEVTVNANPPAPYADGVGTQTFLLANLWFDIDTGSGFTPYLGGGVGAGYVTTSGTLPGPTAIDLSGWGWAYQVGAGVKVDVADNVALDLGYRYKAIVDADLTGGPDDAIAQLGSHVLQVGLTVGF